MLDMELDEVSDGIEVP